MKYCLLIIILIVLIPSVADCQVAGISKHAGNTSGNRIKVPAGSFESFYEKKNTNNRIQVDEFYLDTYAVTNADFMEFLQENPEWSKGNVARLFADTNYLGHWNSDFITDGEVLKSPVVNVSWFTTNAYCSWRGKRLPTTSEWEYAAAQEVIADKGDTINVLDIILAWYSKPNPKTLPNVGSGYQNIFGVFDMHGLIWEWTSDFNSYVTGGDSRSSDELERNLFCASGSFGAVDKKNYAAFMRYGFRGSLKGNYCIRNLGFRCASDLVSTKNKTQ